MSTRLHRAGYTLIELILTIALMIVGALGLTFIVLLIMALINYLSNG